MMSALELEACQAIQSVRDRFMEAVREGDAAKAASAYTPDGQMFPQGVDIVQGTQAIHAFWQAAFDLGTANVSLEVLEMTTRDDMAIEVQRYTFYNHHGRVLDWGNSLLMWRQDGEAWRIHRDMWTTARKMRRDVLPPKPRV